MKIVINRCFGGFGLSQMARDYLGWSDEEYWEKMFSEGFRYSDELIEVVQKFGEEANGDYSKLRIVEIPDDVDWVITDYDGMEQIEEVHRVWR